MKVTNWLSAAALLVLATASILSAQTSADELDMALRDASDYLNGNLPKGSKIVILNIESASANLSEYIIEEITANAVNDKNFSVVDRRQLETIQAEQKFQMSGAVDDKDAQAIGKFFGAQTIISGTMSAIGDRYRLTIRALDVKTALVQGQFNRNMSISETLAGLVGFVVGGGQPYDDGTHSYDGSSEKTLVTLNGGGGVGAAEVGGDGKKKSKADGGDGKKKPKVDGGDGKKKPKVDSGDGSRKETAVVSGGLLYVGLGAGFIRQQSELSLYDPTFMCGALGLGFGAGKYFHIGLNWEPGILPINDELINNESVVLDSLRFQTVNLFARAYVSENVYFSGGVGMWFHDEYAVEIDNGSYQGNLSFVGSEFMPLFSVGIGFVVYFDRCNGLYADAQYKFLPGGGSIGGYLAINVGALVGGRVAAK